MSRSIVRSLNDRAAAFGWPQDGGEDVDMGGDGEEREELEPEPELGGLDDADRVKEEDEKKGGAVKEEKKGEVKEGSEIIAASAAVVSAAEKQTTRYMTKYERARVLGTRALQIRCVCVVFSLPLRRCAHVRALGAAWALP